MQRKHLRPSFPPNMRASYLLGILAYGLGMTLSIANQVPAGLIVLCAATAAAFALFRARST